MRSIVSFVGKSGSGKTTLLEKVITELKQRGYKVAIIKHSHHENDLDTAEKDTWRFTRAGTEFSAINSLDHLAIYHRMSDFFDPLDISNFILWDYDILLTEGFKGSNYPKIEVHNSQQGKDLVTDPSLLLAAVTDEPLPISVPQLTRDDISGVADIIEKTIISQKGVSNIAMVINGKPAPVSPVMQDLLTRTFAAMIPGLTHDNEINSLHISLRRNH
jgi:molybdopterin-guanine dinucleotide biosynthesis protein MobB